MRFFPLRYNSNAIKFTLQSAQPHGFSIVHKDLRHKLQFISSQREPMPVRNHAPLPAPPNTTYSEHFKSTAPSSIWPFLSGFLAHWSDRRQSCILSCGNRLTVHCLPPPSFPFHLCLVVTWIFPLNHEQRLHQHSSTGFKVEMCFPVSWAYPQSITIGHVATAQVTFREADGLFPGALLYNPTATYRDACYSCSCVYGCVHTCTCALPDTCVCQGSEVVVGRLTRALSTLPLRCSFLTDPEAHGSAREQPAPRPTCLCCPYLDLNSGPRACAASILQAKPQPQFY